ncbi:MAG: ABC transporter permease [Vicinamibacteria bacterium]|jgi:ABC-2 type transport system permease protein|nr:ABC transporter permease [Vicinamibacteria bacterium]
MTTLRNVGFIIQKEWRHYFASPIAYVALTFWALLFGGFFSLYLTYFLRVTGTPSRMGGTPRLNDIAIEWTLSNMAVVALFILPMITMRLLAEEKRQGTIELLATSPITDFEILMGKFLGALGLYATMLASGYLCFSSLWIFAAQNAAPDWRPVVTSVLAMLLLGGSFIALGLFVSSLTRNQIVAGVVTFALLLLIWILGWLEDPAGGAFSQGIAYLSLISHATDMIKGILDLKDVVYFMSFTSFCLFLAHQSMESQRWRA